MNPERGGAPKAEKPSVTVKVLTKREFSKKIFHKTPEGYEPDSRFANEAVFKYFNPNDLGNMWEEDVFYFCGESSDLVVALGKLERNPHEKERKIFWIKFISVDPEHAGEGNASRIAESMFEFARSKDAALESSSYSDEGYTKLKPLFKRLAEQYSVEFIDNEGRV